MGKREHPLKVVIAPDKYKGSCPADRVAAAIARGWLALCPGDEAVLVPVADGGDGTLEAMRAACGGTYHTMPARGPLGEPVEGRWLRLADGTAVVEMAQVSGLHLVEKSQLDVRRADTYGTGQLLCDALDKGCRRFIVGIGGSATNDGGMGMLRALGARFFGAGGELTIPCELHELESVDFAGFDSRIADCEIIVACDVANPLCGKDGASAVYGPQKGASPEDVRHMDNSLGRLAATVARGMGLDRSGSPGAGAAGGLGWALLQCCGAEMRPGIGVVLDAAGFDTLLADAGLIITGEGSLDGQTAMGKVPVGIARRVAGTGIPVAVIAGSLGVGHEAVYSMGIDCAIGIAPGPMSLAEAMANAEELIEKAAMRLARIVNIGRRVGKAK
jgi:glycerate kinase